MSTTQMLTRTPGVRGNPVHDEVKKAALTDYMAGDSPLDISEKYGISLASIANWAKAPAVLTSLGFDMTPEEVIATRRSNYKGRRPRAKTEALSSTIRTSARKSKNNKATSDTSSSPIYTAMHYCPCCGTDMFAVGVAVAASKEHQ